MIALVIPIFYQLAFDQKDRFRHLQKSFRIRTKLSMRTVEHQSAVAFFPSENLAEKIITWTSQPVEICKEAEIALHRHIICSLEEVHERWMEFRPYALGIIDWVHPPSVKVELFKRKAVVRSPPVLHNEIVEGSAAFRVQAVNISDWIFWSNSPLSDGLEESHD